ncbi:MAG TPA: hypothetical protein VKU00_12195 [Chthonomonadaceae bacterium]|nr:hypothetical protein [Chthonomonadaceae bacterium]
MRHDDGEIVYDFTYRGKHIQAGIASRDTGLKRNERDMPASNAFVKVDGKKTHGQVQQLTFILQQAIQNNNIEGEREHFHQTACQMIDEGKMDGL